MTAPQPSARSSLWWLAWLFAALILLQACLAVFSSYTLSVVRAYVRGESLWSRGAKDAVYYLSRYINTGSPQDYLRYQQAIDLPLGDLDARLALERNAPDRVAYAAFIRGGSDPEDIPGIIWLFRNFRGLPDLSRSIQSWRDTDRPLQELVDIAATIHRGVSSNARIPADARGLLEDRLQDIQLRLSPRSAAFSASLSKASRALKTQLITLNIVTAALLTLLMLLLSRRLVRQRHAFETELSWQATHDALTGLPNRRDFEHHLGAAIGTLADSRTARGLILLDLDQLKVVNDTCGHAAGDQLLRQTSEVFRRELREGDLLARIGGDEFAILTGECDLDNAAGLAERLRLATQSTPFQWEGRTFSITVSIGVTPVIDAGATLEEALRVADVACYMAKENGRNRVEVHRAGDSELQQRFGEMGWLQVIRQGLERGCFSLHAQEVRALSRQEPGLHLELLLRLQGEDGELVPPGRFIPAAERYGLMPMIDRWVVHAAFRIIAAHLAAPAARPLATCAINLSGASFGDATCAGYIRKQFAAHAIPPSMICFELTETSVMTNLGNARRFMEELGTLGCRFALDVFGSGMSSLGYLKQLPVNCIKIDGSFVRDMLHDPIDRAMVEMIGQLGRVMGMSTIAEFVEDDATLAVLREIGIDYAQGYAIGQPQPFGVPGAPADAALPPGSAA